jgi:hypothetical protein
MQLRNYLKDKRKLTESRTKVCVEVGKTGEALFKEITGALKSNLEDDKKLAITLKKKKLDKHLLN